MYADTVDKCKALLQHPMFGYARSDFNEYNKSTLYIYNNTPNNDGPARGGRVFAGVADAEMFYRALQELKGAGYGIL
jgi:hypothetical protein